MKAEIRRQLIHFLFGSLFIAMIALVGTALTLEILIACLLIGIIVSLILVKGHNIPIISPVVKEVEREHEKEWPGKGAILFFLAAIIVILLFQNQIVVLGALSALIYGDSASTIFGIKFGKHKIVGKRTLEGTIAGMLAMLPFLFAIVSIPVAIATAIVSMLAELLPINDNFSIPIAAAIVLTILL